MKARTKGEKHAFLDGYAQALQSVQNAGFEQASDWLATMALKENYVTPVIGEMRRRKQ